MCMEDHELRFGPETQASPKILNQQCHYSQLGISWMQYAAGPTDDQIGAGMHLRQSDHDLHSWVCRDDVGADRYLTTKLIHFIMF